MGELEETVASPICIRIAADSSGRDWDGGAGGPKAQADLDERLDRNDGYRTDLSASYELMIRGGSMAVERCLPRPKAREVRPEPALKTAQSSEAYSDELS